MEPIIVLLLLLILSVVAVAIAIRDVVTDGYHRVPTRQTDGGPLPR